jgi:hypothetical protein
MKVQYIVGRKTTLVVNNGRVRSRNERPGVLPALAGVVHDRHSAADYEQSHGEDN